MNQDHIRNFCIIAHIDHGKSTLADRLLEVTKTVSSRDMAAQFLDSMDLERERGITIKASPIQMFYDGADGETYELNLLDTPGHVEFSYEVSRSVAACEGALLVVDASQGIQAQTLANVYLAMEHDLYLIPVVNKIDLPGAEPERVAQELVDALGFARSDIFFISAKDGDGVDGLLDAIITLVPPPSGDPAAPTRALIFDSKYDSYKGVIASVRVMDGSLGGPSPLRLMAAGKNIEPLEVGVFKPGCTPVQALVAGEVGYIATGLKTLQDSRVGDTVTVAARPATVPLPGYRELKPMVFAGLFPTDGQEYIPLREALERLKLNDAGLVYEMENSGALGFGFRCGFLGLLHMEIVQNRLEREYGLDLLATAPSVGFEVLTTKGETILVSNPSELPPANFYVEIREPWLEVTIVVPARFVGAVMDLVSSRRGTYRRMEYLEAKDARESREAEPAQDPRVLLAYEMPLAEVLVDFYDQLVPARYELLEYRPGHLSKVDILVNEKPVDALSLIVHRDRLPPGPRPCRALTHPAPDVRGADPVGNKVIARETIRALRKNVLAKCYGGDVTRKMKLLKKQSEGKKRMKRVGNVDIPQEAFLAVLKLDEK